MKPNPAMWVGLADIRELRWRKETHDDIKALCEMGLGEVLYELGCKTLETTAKKLRGSWS